MRGPRTAVRKARAHTAGIFASQSPFLTVERTRCASHGHTHAHTNSNTQNTHTYARDSATCTT